MGTTEELAKLDEMRAKGTISQQDYDQAKADLLEKEQAVPAGATGGGMSEKDTNMWGMIIHLSQFCGYVVPMAGLVVPIVLWQMKKAESPTIDAHGCLVANWLLSALIYGVVCIPLCFIVIGIFGIAVLGILAVVFPIVGAVKANNGEVWPYPLSIKFFSPAQ